MHNPDPALTAADRARLAKLLGMIGSSHDGEALAAARLADKLIRDRRLRWHDIFGVPAADPQLDDWRTAATACVRLGPGVLTDLEITFAFPRCSDKQLGILRRLVDKLLLTGVVS